MSESAVELESRPGRGVLQAAEEAATVQTSLPLDIVASTQNKNHNGANSTTTSSSSSSSNGGPSSVPRRRRGRRPRVPPSMARAPSTATEVSVSSSSSAILASTESTAPLRGRRRRHLRAQSTVSHQSDRDTVAPHDGGFLCSTQIEHGTTSIEHECDADEDGSVRDRGPSRFTTPIGGNLAGVNIRAMLAEGSGETNLTYTRRLRRNRRRQALTEDSAIFRDHRELRRTHHRRSHPTAPISTAADVLQSITEWNDSPALVYAQLLWHYTPEAMLELVLRSAPHATSTISATVKLEASTPTPLTLSGVKQEAHEGLK